MLVKRDLTTMGGQPRPAHVKSHARNPGPAAGKQRHRQRRFKGGRDARRAA
jgi:hypothetical protein